MQLNRRNLLQSGMMAGAGLAFSPMFVHAAGNDEQKEKLEKMGVGLVGCGGRGHANGREFAHVGRIIALCDVNEDRMKNYLKDKKMIPRPDKVVCDSDYRKLLDRKDIDIISISTVDHWHVKIAAEALAAGKHVFCEKPLTFTAAENKYIREKAAKSNRTFSVGTQQRTMKDSFMTATLMVRAGLLGRLEKVIVHLLPGPVRGPFEVKPVPSALNWDRWCGQVPMTDFMPERCHGTFRYWYEYAGGQFTDWGAHHIDCAQWALGEDRPGCGPIEIDGRDAVHATELDENGYPIRHDCFNTATTFNIKCRFASGVRMEIISSRDNGIMFEGTEGRIFVNRGKLTGKPIEEGRHKKFTPEDFVKLNHGKPVEWQKGNFMRCIQEGGLPSSDVESHTVALNTCHLCSIAARLKRVVRWDPEKETIPDDPQAAAFLSKTPRKGYEMP